MDRISLGRHGEELAARHLEQLGYSLLERNWRCELGELDIVAHDPAEDALVFCEVKCRSGTGFGAPLEAITVAKLRRLRLLAGRWVAVHPITASRIRIDAIGVLIRAGRPSLQYVRGVA